MDDQVRRDAMADAETLRQAQLSCGGSYLGLARAAMPYRWYDDPAFTGWEARLAIRAARAAFRAVPGLRGDKR